MSLFHAIRARMRALFWRRRADDEMDEEIQFHLDRETEHNMRLGMSARDARRMAVARFGGVQRVREEHRDIRAVRWLEDFVADVRFALRGLRRAPAIAIAAVVTLALGIAANVAIFSAVNAVVLQPLPFPQPDRLMMIGEENPEKHWHLQLAAPANMLDWRAGVADFQDVAGYFEGVSTTTLTGYGEPQILGQSFVTGNLFSTLRVAPQLGRDFTFAETFAAGSTHVALLSDRAWRDRFRSDPAIVGRTILLNRRPVRIVGIMPPRFSYPEDGVDVWRPMEWETAFRNSVAFRRAHGVRVVARLRPGASREHAAAELQTVVARLQHDYPGTNRVMGALMVPLHDWLVGDTRLPLLVLLTSVALLLLIACANVGNLLLLHAVGHAREAAVRLALGAGRGRLVRQALAESVVLSGIGGAVGLGMGWAATRAIVRLQPARMLRVHDFGVDTTVLLYVLLITAGSGVLFGTAPALWARRRDPAESLKDGVRGSGTGRRRKRWSEVLVTSEVALALVMAVGAGLLVRSFLGLRQVDPGFDPHGIFLGEVSLGAAYDSDAKVLGFMDQLQARARALPTVTGVALAMNVPFTGVSYTSDFIAYGRPTSDAGVEVGHMVVSPSYFATMKIPLRSGRVFTDAERPRTTPVIVINEALARSYFHDANPIGQRIAFDRVPTPKSTWHTIIGVVANEHVDRLDLPPRIEVYHSFTQEPDGFAFLIVRTTADPAALGAPVRAVMHDLDPNLAIAHVTTMDALRDRSLARSRFLTAMLLGFAIIGVVLAIVGVYGVLAQLSRTRTREMGIRLALGARSRDVSWLVVRHGLRLAASGLALGAVAALFATKLMTSLLFAVAPNDPGTLVAVVVLLGATSLVAAWIPAARAGREDPAQVLRAE